MARLIKAVAKARIACIELAVGPEDEGACDPNAMAMAEAAVRNAEIALYAAQDEGRPA
jgi:hypothetical protein